MTHCSACFHTKHSTLAPNQLQATNASEPKNPPARSPPLFSSPDFLARPPPFHIFVPLALIHGPLPLAFCFRFFLPSLSPFSAPVGLFLHPSGSTEVYGIGPGPPGFHSDTLCPDVISIDDAQLGQAVLAHRLFTVYSKLKPFTVRLARLSVCV